MKLFGRGLPHYLKQKTAFSWGCVGVNQTPVKFLIEDQVEEDSFIDPHSSLSSNLRNPGSFGKTRGRGVHPPKRLGSHLVNGVWFSCDTHRCWVEGITSPNAE